MKIKYVNARKHTQFSCCSKINFYDDICQCKTVKSLHSPVNTTHQTVEKLNYSRLCLNYIKHPGQHFCLYY